MLATDFPGSDSLAFDLALEIVRNADSWTVEDDARTDSHSDDADVLTIARHVFAEDRDFFRELVASHMCNPRRRDRGRSLAAYEWRLARPIEHRRIGIRLDLSRAETAEKRAEIEGWLAATF